jgi:ferredoxin--NADP+ reductase
MADQVVHVVAVVGAGPAGLFATRALASQGCRVLLLNRDIKPGGLAEYGIFLAKHKMKGGLRKQFQRILSDPHVTYLGNVTIREGGTLTVEDLRGMGFDALVFAIGAQGTKYLGIDGERLAGVYHAKDLVYHYNRLPPFAEQPFPLGRRVVIVGIGNVMIDIANYAAHFCDCEEIVAIARRGPFEKAYDDKEFEDVEDAFDREAYRSELARIRPQLAAIDQNADALLKDLDGRDAPDSQAKARLRFRFLCAPKRVIGEGGRVVALEVEETRLERKDDRIVAMGTGVLSRVPCDTVVFAVGDRVDEHAGLPYRDGLYVTGPSTGPDPAAAYQVWEPETGRPMDGVFVVGWARRASDGVVGRARLDAETGIKHVLAYLAAKPRRAEAEAEHLVSGVVAALEARGAQVVTHADVKTIEAEERTRAAEAKVEEFKFASNREMLALLRR